MQSEPCERGRASLLGDRAIPSQHSVRPALGRVVRRLPYYRADNCVKRYLGTR